MKLFLFFFKRFLYNFCLFLFLLTVILGIGNVFIKIAFFSNISAIWFIFMALVPIMGIFSFPVAAGLAVHTAIGNLMIDDEILLIRFFSSAKRSLFGAVFVFSFLCSAVYIPLTFHWAPQSYLAGKRALLQFAKKRFCHLEAGRMHTPFPGVTFFFKKKKNEVDMPNYSFLFLAFNNKNGERYLFVAQRGVWKDNRLYLHRGSIYSMDSGKHYFATFEKTEINLNDIFNLDHDHLPKYQAKFLTTANLWQAKDDAEVFYEFHKRLVQVLWLLLIPFFALINILSFGCKKSNILLGLLFNGLFFLASYISMSLAHTLWLHQNIAITLLYGTIGVFLLLNLLIYLRKSNF